MLSKGRCSSEGKQISQKCDFLAYRAEIEVPLLSHLYSDGQKVVWVGGLQYIVPGSNWEVQPCEDGEHPTLHSNKDS